MRVLLASLLSLVATAVFCIPVMAEPDGAEIAYWESVRDSRAAAELEAYLEAYPEGTFAALARLRLKALQAVANDKEKPRPAAADNGSPDGTGSESQRISTNPAESFADGLTLTLRLALSDINGEQRTILGVRIRDLSQQQRSCFGISDTKGILVEEVFPQSPAMDAGIRVGDIIQEFDGISIETASRLSYLVSEQSGGAKAQINLLRPRPLNDENGPPPNSAAENDASGMLCLSFRHMYGLGLPKDVAKANRWLLKSAEAGNASAMYSVAVNLANGNGINKDEAEASRWFRKASEAGSTDAMVHLAFHLEYGKGITKDVAEANRWYRKAASLGNPHAMNNLATNLHIGNGAAKNTTESMDWYRQGAEGGSVMAMSNLGISLATGDGIAKDGAQAARWLQKAAQAKNSRAMYFLGWLHDRGEGVEQDSRLAAQWVFKAIRSGGDFEVKHLRENAGEYSSPFRREFQRLLLEAGHYQGAVDGKFGTGTERAIEALRAAGKDTFSAAAPNAPAPSLPADLGPIKDLEELD